MLTLKVEYVVKLKLKLYTISPISLKYVKP